MNFQIAGTEANCYIDVTLEGFSRATLKAENAHSEGITNRKASALIFSLLDKANECFITNIIGKELILTIAWQNLFT